MDPRQDGSYVFADQAAARLPLSSLFYRVKAIGHQPYDISPVLSLKQRKEYKPIVISFPNEFDQQLSISYQVNRGEIQSLSIRNALGKAVALEESPAQKGEWTLASADWPAGIYYLRLQTDEQKRVYKIRKK